MAHGQPGRRGRRTPALRRVTRGRGRPAAGSEPLAEERLLEAALDLFAEVGFDGASVRELCRRLGVSHGLVHQRYGSKERLWYAAVDWGFEDLAAEFLAAAAAAPDGVEEIRQVLIRFLEVTAARPALMQVVNAESVTPGERLDHIVDSYLGPAIEVMEDVLGRLGDQDRVRPVDPALLYVLVTHGAGGALSLTALADRIGLKDARVNPREYAEAVVDLILHGLATDNPPEAEV